MVFLFYLSVIIAGLIFLLTIESYFGLRAMKDLENVPESNGPFPVVSIIAAALNEEKKIRDAVESFLSLDYPHKEIIIVNDRSTDRTGVILDEMKNEFPELSVVQVKELPVGWLGKNHAQFLGARQAKGALFLFTDADVVMEKSILKRAVHLVQKEQLDHLAVIPHVPFKPRLLQMTHVGFMMFFNMAMRPWRIANPKSKAFGGIGAFNMFKREAYDAIGTHRRIAYRPDDDMRLGQLIKKLGLRQRMLFGFQLLKVEWYETMGQMFNGLMKNSFAGLNYSVLFLVGSTAAFLLLFYWPFAGLFLTTGWARLACVIAIALHILWAGITGRRAGYPLWYGAGIYFAAGFLLAVLWTASLRALIRGGIEWRGTFYPLKALKSNKI